MEFETQNFKRDVTERIRGMNKGERNAHKVKKGSPCLLWKSVSGEPFQLTVEMISSKQN